MFSTISCFPLILRISAENRTKLKKSNITWTTDSDRTQHHKYSLHLIFLSLTESCSSVLNISNIFLKILWTFCFSGLGNCFDVRSSQFNFLPLDFAIFKKSWAWHRWSSHLAQSWSFSNFSEIYVKIVKIVPSLQNEAHYLQ